MPYRDARAPGLSRESVPITMGSPRFETTEAGPFRVTRASFVGRDVLDTHTHDRTTFAVMLAGGFDLHFPNPSLRRRTLPCVAGTVFTEPIAETHANRIAASGASVLVIQTDPRATEELRPFRELLDGVHCFTHAGLELAARRLARELAAADDLTPLALRAGAAEMLACAIRAVGPGARTRARRPAWLRRVGEFVHDRFRDRITLDDIAREAGVSASHLAAVFREAHEVSLGAYVRALRIDWAARRLAGGRDSISRIAFQAGFADQPHLTRAFKRATGRTPGAWRAETKT